MEADNISVIEHVHDSLEQPASPLPCLYHMSSEKMNLPPFLFSFVYSNGYQKSVYCFMHMITFL